MHSASVRVLIGFGRPTFADRRKWAGGTVTLYLGQIKTCYRIEIQSIIDLRPEKIGSKHVVWSDMRSTLCGTPFAHPFALCQASLSSPRLAISSRSKSIWLNTSHCSTPVCSAILSITCFSSSSIRCPFQTQSLRATRMSSIGNSSSIQRLCVLQNLLKLGSTPCSLRNASSSC